MGKLRYLWIFCLLIAMTAAAPAEEEKEVISTTLKPQSKPADRVDVTDIAVVKENWMSWLTGNWKSIGMGLVALCFVLGGVSLGYYYYLGPIQLAGRDTASTPTAAYANPYLYTGRSLDQGLMNRWDFAQVLEFIDIAQKTYEGFDWQDMNCQYRTLCEVSQQQNEWAVTGRKITNNYILKFLDALDGIPIPRVVQAVLKAYKESIDYGTTGKNCAEKYHQCNFSIKEVLADVGKKRAKKF